MKKIIGLILFSFVLLIGCAKVDNDKEPVAEPDLSEEPGNTDNNEGTSGEKPTEDDSESENPNDNSTGDQSDKDDSDSESPSSGQDSAGVKNVKIYFIGIEDNGESGKKVGATDSVIPVTIDIEPTKAPLKAALSRLLAIDEQMYGQSGFYHSLYQSDLEIQSIVIKEGEATIKLTGNLKLGGALDNPRVKAQIEETALQFDSVKKVSIFINGKEIDDVLSLKGE